MDRRVIALLALLAVAGSAATAERFSLGLEGLELEPVDPRTEARLAQWNSPMGRLTAHMQQEQAMLGRGGLVGGPPQAIAVGVKLQRGFRVQLYAAVSEAGIDRYERSVEVVSWPWQPDGLEVLPIEEQLARLLGHRLSTQGAVSRP